MPTLGIIDTQTVKCIAVRGPCGYDPAKLMVGRKRVALVDADGALVHLKFKSLELHRFV
jgi:hypothetical protein